MFKTQFLVSLLFLIFTKNVNSQIDTTFWFVAPDISQGLGDRPIYLYFNTYSQASTVKVRQPANGGFATITLNIPANSIDSINLTPFISDIENSTANLVSNKGIYISSTQKISTLYSINSTLNKEHFSLKGPKALGTDFYIPMQEFWKQSPATSPKSFSSFDIVASENNTTVLITPKTAIIGHAANATFTVLLQQGESFSCQDTSRSAITSLGGSLVSSNKPVAVTIQSSGLNQSGCLSSVGDQITNSKYIGTDYIVNKGTATTEKIFVLVTQNNTQITFNDGSATTYVGSFGETFVYTATQGITYIKSNKPVYALHVSGYGCRLSGTQLPPFYCAGTYTTSFTRTSADSMAINLVTRTGFESNFALNGIASLIPASAFTVVPGTSGLIKSAKIYYPTTTIAVGSHNTVTNSGDVFGLSVLNGSRNNGSAYATLSEFESYPSINAGNDFTICANGSLLLDGKVGGGDISGIWSTNGYGSFKAGFTTLTNTYTPSQLDTTLKPLKIFLTSTGKCSQQKDTLLLTVKQAPLVNASVDQILCVNNNRVILNGTVNGGSTTGLWSSIGSGTFTPDDTQLNSTYLPSTADLTNGFTKLILESTLNGICTVEKDTMKVTFTPEPSSAITQQSISVCANNPTLSVSGLIGGSSNKGKWTSSGNGSFNPSNITLSTNYFPSQDDVLAGQVTLFLTSTNNGNCNAAKDSMVVLFTQPPTVITGSIAAICKNNAFIPLNGSVTGTTTTGAWSGGTGTFTPNNSALTATYTPTQPELDAGFVNLTLSSTNNLNCNQVNSSVLVNFTSPPTVNAGVNLSICKNNINTRLSGIVTGTTTTGIWSGGTGTFTPSSAALNATYTPSSTDLSLGVVSLTLTSTNMGNCSQVTDEVKINYTIIPSVFTSTNISTCKNNPTAVISGTVSGATTTGVWSGGSGSYNPSNAVLNPTYTPSTSELSAGFVNLTLTSSNNGNCLAVSNTVQINYTAPPVANAGITITSCKNNANSVLSGTITGPTTTGIWSGGTGTYTPSNSILNATYTPSAPELLAGFVNLTLTSSNNDNCNSSSSNLLINFTNPPLVSAGSDLYACKNSSSATLLGTVSGTTSTGLWAGGSGTYTPSNTSLNAIYKPTTTELNNGAVTLTLTSTNNSNCLAVSDVVKINYTPLPVVSAGQNIVTCLNNAITPLNGNISGATTTGVWSGGSGNYNPSNSVLTSSYSPSGAELTAGSATLILTSSNNGNCLQVKDTVVIVYTSSPIAYAGLDISTCKNNASSVLSGTISGPTTTGSWAGGTGTFTPNNSVLTATYTPSNAEITAGFVNLILKSTNNGNCSEVSDNVFINYTTAPSVYAGIDLFTCNNNPNSTLAGSINGPTNTGIWLGGAGTFTPSDISLNPIYIPTQNEINAGNLKIYLASTNNGTCKQVKDSMIINFTTAPIVNAGIDLSRCKNNPLVSISGSVTGSSNTGIWTGGNGVFLPGNSSLNNTYNPTATEIATGSVSLTLNSTNNGNCNQVRDTIVIYYTNPSVVNAGLDLFSCKNNAKSILNGQITGPTTTGVWTGGNGTYSPNNAVLTATYTPTSAEISLGFVNLTLTTSNNAGCNSINDVVKLNFMQKPFANFNFNNTCLNNATTFTDFSFPGSGTLASWEWTFGDGSNNSSSQNAVHTFSNATTYTTQLVVSNSYGCIDTIKQTPLIYPLPEANFGIRRICNGNLLTLIFSDSTTIASPETVNQWFWDFGGAGQSNQQNPFQLFPGSGLYNVNLISTSNHGCKDTVLKQINLTPRPIAGFAYSISSGVNVGTTINLVDTSSYANTWSWNFGDGSTNSSNLQNPSTIYYDNGTYVITQVVTDGYGCSDTARTAIRVNNITYEISTLIPNAISPNGDGKNDVWKLDFLNILYPNASVDIYNRWGLSVYHSEGNYNTPWDGTFEGKELPVGTYYYVLKLNDVNNTEPFKGGILLIR